MVGRFEELEYQLCAMTVSGWTGARSPDRADACIWALADLFPAMAVAQRRERGAPPKVILGYANAKQQRRR